MGYIKTLVFFQQISPFLVLFGDDLWKNNEAKFCFHFIVKRICGRMRFSALGQRSFLTVHVKVSIRETPSAKLTIYLKYTNFHRNKNFRQLFFFNFKDRFASGLPDGIFSNKNPNLGKFWNVLQ
jgi:hypothetical protein